MKGTTYLKGRPLLGNMSPCGKSQGGWAFTRPADTSDIFLYRPKFPDLVLDQAPIWERVVKAEAAEAEAKTKAKAKMKKPPDSESDKKESESNESESSEKKESESGD